MKAFISIFSLLLILFTVIIAVLIPSKKRHKRTMIDAQILAKNK